MANDGTFSRRSSVYAIPIESSTNNNNSNNGRNVVYAIASDIPSNKQGTLYSSVTADGKGGYASSSPSSSSSSSSTMPAKSAQFYSALASKGYAAPTTAGASTSSSSSKTGTLYSAFAGRGYASPAAAHDESETDINTSTTNNNNSNKVGTFNSSISGGAAGKQAVYAVPMANDEDA